MAPALRISAQSGVFRQNRIEKLIEYLRTFVRKKFTAGGPCG